jgi:hypothetical protein
MGIDKVAITRSIGRSILLAKKNSPHIFFGLGLAGTITSTVLACRATLKLEELLEEVKQDFEAVKALHENPTSSTYNPQDYHKDLCYVYGKSIAKVLKLYGPSIIIGVASVASLTGSHIQLTRRNAALTFTLAAVSKAYEEYRARVIEEVGEDREREIYHNIHEEEVEINGKKELVKVAGNSYSPYARFFDEFSIHWKRDPETNRMFLKHQENYANHLLVARGHVLLNDVYDALGFERTRAGAVVGWVKDGQGDNCIDFGVLQIRNARFVNGLEHSILLDFNVDGVIYNLIGSDT